MQRVAVLSSARKRRMTRVRREQALVAEVIRLRSRPGAAPRGSTTALGVIKEPVLASSPERFAEVCA
jgi:hypothetical protein